VIQDGGNPASFGIEVRQLAVFFQTMGLGIFSVAQRFRAVHAQASFAFAIRMVCDRKSELLTNGHNFHLFALILAHIL
jgi:hypothetical protein